jgi:hypothetical protein
MPTDRTLLVAALVCFAIATIQLPLRINLVALGLALATLALVFR